jgi:1,4-dihydroxy-2-naphthoate polyprenyltransferase
MSPSFRLPMRRTSAPSTVEAESSSHEESESRNSGVTVPEPGAAGADAAVESPTSRALDPGEHAGAPGRLAPDDTLEWAPRTESSAAPPEPTTPAAPPEPQPEPEPELEPDGRQVTVGDGIALLAAYNHAVLSWVAEDGYPMNVDVEIDVKTAEGTVRFGEPPGFHLEPGTAVAITGSHVHPLPAGGFDERSHVTVYGPASARPRGRFAVSPNRVWVWGAHDLPLAASYARRLGQARRYYEADSIARGAYSRPRLSARVAVFRAVHAPFLRATFVPIFLGIAIAIRAGVVDLLTALMALALVGAVHLGLNIASGLFDLLHSPGLGERGSALSGAARGTGFGRAIDEIKGLPPEATASFALAAVLALLLLPLRGSPELLLFAVGGTLLALAFRFPPFKLADRGLGEPAAAIGFGPALLVGTYALQSRGTITAEAIVLSVPVGLFAGLIVLIDEIPNRAGDARAGRKTLPVRWSKSVTIRCFEVAAAAAFATLAIGVVAGWLPIPALLALLAVPMVMRVRGDLTRLYGRPYELAAVLAANVRLQTNVGLLLAAGYAFTIADQILLQRAPFLR